MKRFISFLIVAVLYICQSRADDDLRITSIQYWIDNDHTAATVGSSMEFDIDCSALPAGLHTLHYRIADNKGNFSTLKEHSFFKLPSVATKSKVETLQYWWDGMQQKAKTIPYTSEEFILFTDTLPHGLHTLHYRIADNNGNYSTPKEHSFFKMPTVAAHSKVETIQYWWDDMHQKAMTMPYSPEEFIISADALSVGLHTFKYRVKDDAGVWTDLRSHYFYRGEALDSARIVSYSYWWNDLAETSTSVKLETPIREFMFDEDFSVPEVAKTNYAGHYTATLNFAITDNHGRTAFLKSDVTYPDNDSPTTDIDADKYVASSSVVIKWEEKTDDKMGDYNVYFSKDNGPFILWLPDTKLTSSTFKGERGSMYLFTVTGRDAFGNREKFDETKCVSVTFE